MGSMAAKTAPAKVACPRLKRNLRIAILWLLIWKCKAVLLVPAQGHGLAILGDGVWQRLDSFGRDFAPIGQGKKVPHKIPPILLGEVGHLEQIIRRLLRIDLYFFWANGQHTALGRLGDEIGRASCRERMCVSDLSGR